MDFKYINDRNTTPNGNNKNIFSSTLNGENSSPFSVMPSYSTPPSRNISIFNPFEQHLIHRLHLPVFSPSVFTKVSTPKAKFKWSIDEISNLNPADIDEEAVSQHVVEEDPQVESLIQQKIEAFFSSEHVIVPSPDVVSMPTRLGDITETPKRASNSPRHSFPSPGRLCKSAALVNDNNDEELQSCSELHQQLFDFKDEMEIESSSERNSSPAISTGMSPIQFSPLSPQGHPFDCSFSSVEQESSPECPKRAKSACRLDFSGVHMDIATVPDVNGQMSFDIDDDLE